MKKKDLASLALMGLASGMMIGCQPTGTKESKNGSKMEQSQMTKKEQDFYNKLDRDGQKKFAEMKSSDRKKAMDAYDAGCKGMNECKGMGGCKTNSHDCKGENSCRGRGGCAVDDPNEAVDMADKTMHKNGNSMHNQRSNMRNGHSSNNGRNY